MELKEEKVNKQDNDIRFANRSLEKLVEKYSTSSIQELRMTNIINSLSIEKFKVFELILDTIKTCAVKEGKRVFTRTEILNAINFRNNISDDLYEEVVYETREVFEYLGYMPSIIENARYKTVTRITIKYERQNTTKYQL